MIVRLLAATLLPASLVLSEAAAQGPATQEPLPTAPQQEPPSASADPALAPKPGECGRKAALYQDAKGTKIWVTRHGRMALAENPLRPLSRDTALVLEVVVNGRLATAYGPDPDHLRQGGAVQTVEREGAEPVRWAGDGLDAAALRVIAEDGRILLGPMAFAGCEEAPGAKPIAPAAVKADIPEPPRKGKGGKPAADPGPRPGPNLPQGALPGLSLPKSAPAR